MFVSDPPLLIPALAVFHEVLSDLFVEIAVHHSPPKMKQSCGPEPGRPPIFLLWLKSGTSHFTTILWNKTSCQALHEELELLGGSQAWLWIQERCFLCLREWLRISCWSLGHSHRPYFTMPTSCRLVGTVLVKGRCVGTSALCEKHLTLGLKNDLNSMGLSSSLNFYNQSKDDIF